MNSASPQSLRVCRTCHTIADKPCARDKRKRGAPTHDLHGEHPHPTRPTLTNFSLTANKLDEQREKDLGFGREFCGELLEQEEDDACAAECKGERRAFGECLEEQRAEMVLQ
jgi:hypothetical protein